MRFEVSRQVWLLLQHLVDHLVSRLRHGIHNVLHHIPHVHGVHVPINVFLRSWGVRGALLSEARERE
jgi:hypothetical protein